MPKLIWAILNLIEMKQMKDRMFLDTNVVLYALDKSSFKQQISMDLLKSNPIISTQVLNEFSNTIIKALDLKSKYNFQYYDSLIVATALENHCKILYSEDMQDGLIVEQILTIINPFKKEEI